MQQPRDDNRHGFERPHVCTFRIGDGIYAKCFETFATEGMLNAHRWAEHGEGN